MPKAIIMRGNLSEGFRAIGPFFDRDEAAERANEPGDWIIALIAPGLCSTCSVKDHDRCPLEAGCPCCDTTHALLND